MTERRLKEHWCQEKYDFCRPDGTNEAHREVAKMLQAEMGVEPVVIKCFGLEVPTELFISKEMAHDLVHHNEGGVEALVALPETMKALTDGLQALVKKLAVK